MVATYASALLPGRASNLGFSQYDCIEKLNITNCNRDDFYWDWACVCDDQPALDAVNNCITSSCSSSDQNCTSPLCPDVNGPHTNVAFPAIFANIAQACADQGSPITAAPAEATFSATSGGTLFASGVGHGSGRCASDGGPGDGRGHGYGHDRAGHCSWTTFTGNWGGWDVSWAGFGLDDNCSTTAGSTPTAATSPSGVSASATGTGSLSLGATVTTTINGQTLTGTIFNAQGALVSATSGTAAVAAASGGSAGSERMGALAAIFVALLAAACML